MYKKIISVLLILTILFTNTSILAEDFSDFSKASILIERSSGRILYSRNKDSKMPMASTTKIMTALLALERGNLEEIVTIKGNWIGIEGSSIYLQEGEKIRLKDLIYGLILRSGNDAAVAIACHIAGSVEEFANMMNIKAKKIGAYNTNFVNPHGLHNDNHYTTAYDLALITREALNNETFRNISKTRKWIAERDTNGYFYNKNKTLWQYKGGDGVKIGYTTAAGRCLVASATKENMQLIAVVLNDGNWFNDCYGFFDYGFDKYNSINILNSGDFITNIDIIDGNINKIPVKVNESFSFPLCPDEIKDVKITMEVPEKLYAPLLSKQKIGKLKIFLKGELIHSQYLYSDYDIRKKTFLNKTIDFVESLF